jgi:phosphopantetheinyl transferase
METRRANAPRPVALEPGALAVVALVHSNLVRAAEHATPSLAEMILSAEELEQFAKAVTKKRRIELLAGRLAAKSACLWILAAEGKPVPRLREITVRRNRFGRPECVTPGGTTQQVSIAHSGDLAVAISTPDDALVGIDIEPAGKRLDAALDGYFHPTERAQLEGDADACRRWTIRETWAKLTGRGVAADLGRLATVSAERRWWLALPQGDDARAVVAAASTARLTIAVAIGR